MRKYRLTRREIAQQIVGKRSLSTSIAAKSVGDVLDAIAGALKEGRAMELRGFGTFSLPWRNARIGRNPNAPDIPIHIPAQHVIKFNPGKDLRNHFRMCAAE
jgi:nucleoid DNA-binding protein